MNSSGWTEKRRARRREILERFSFFVCIPKLGLARHHVQDISELGIGFRLETLGEFKLVHGEDCELHFYMNPTLYLPVRIRVVRETLNGEEQSIGAELTTPPEGREAWLALVKLIDQLTLSEGVRLNPH
jgi:hypothetical protein